MPSLQRPKLEERDGRLETKGEEENRLGDFQITLSIEKQIVEFEISIDDVVGVEEFQSENNARRIETRALFVEDILVDVYHQVASESVFHDEDALLRHQRFDFVSSENVALLQHFQGVIVAAPVDVLGENHLAEVASAQHAHQTKRVDRNTTRKSKRRGMIEKERREKRETNFASASFAWRWCLLLFVVVAIWFIDDDRTNFSDECRSTSGATVGRVGTFVDSISGAMDVDAGGTTVGNAVLVG